MKKGLKNCRKHITKKVNLKNNLTKAEYKLCKLKVILRKNF